MQGLVFELSIPKYLLAQVIGKQVPSVHYGAASCLALTVLSPPMRTAALLWATVLLCCHRPSPPPPLTRAEIAQRVASQLRTAKPGAVITIEGDQLLLHSREGTGRFSLKTAYSVCARSPATCDQYVQSISTVFDKTEDAEDEDEEMDEPGQPDAASRAPKR